MTRKVTKAVFPVAGLGTRFLPATKSVPKEIMTLVDRPLVQYAIDEARAAGITDFVFVTAKGKSALEDYFDTSPELERALEEKGKDKLLKALLDSNMESGRIAYTRQAQALGLGHAVWCARQFIKDEPFAVMLPDDVILSHGKPCLQQMVEAYGEVGGSMVATMEVSDEATQAYGVIDPADRGGVGSARLVRAAGMVEKPKLGTAPSNLAVIGRYILSPRVMDNLERVEPGAGGEIQLTDAIAMEMGTEEGVHGFRFEGERYDCGSKSGFLQATVAFGLDHDELGEEFERYLAEKLGTLELRDRAAE